MFKNYILISIRNIRKHKLYSAINIFSLAIGLAACTMIYLFIQEERSFDAFHAKNENLYRLDEVQSFPGTNTQKVALSMPGMGPNMMNDFPEIVNFTRYRTIGSRLFERETDKFSIDQVAYVDSTFLAIFDFSLVEGDRETALDEPNSILLTEETARNFFTKEEDVLNEQIIVDGTLFTIKGVLANVPENSHLQFNAVLSMTTITSEDPDFNNQWGSNFLNTYFELIPEASLAEMSSRYPDFLRQYLQPDEGDVNDYYKMFLQPLKDVHLASSDIEHDYNNYRKFNGQYLDVFVMVGIFILLIAGVNFMNLATSRTTYRWKEVGIRKAIGAQKQQLFSQFVVETTLMSIIAFVFAVGISLLFLPILSSMIDRPLSFAYFIDHPILLAIGLFISLGLGLIAGLYPAFYLASFRTIKALKGKGSSGKKSTFQSIMVVVQFGLAIAMIISTIAVIQQLYFIKNKDIGFNKDQIILVDMNQTANSEFQNLKTELNKSSNVLGVTASGQRLGNNFHQWGFRLKTDTAVMEMTPSNVNVDYDYLDVYEIKLKDGRTFNSEILTDNGMAFIINESFAKEIGLEEPVGTPVGHSWYHEDSLGAIIGVVEDFNFNSLHYKVNTLSMVVHPDWGYDELSVKLNSKNVQQSIRDVENVWNELVPDWPFEYTFLDAHFDEMYRSEDQMGKVITLIAVLAILIACMGLFGLVAIAMERKIKEIGIRKVLGASVKQLMLQLSASFALLILIAFVLISPMTTIFLNKWLDNFAFRIDLNIWVFVLGGSAALLIAMLTISYHTFKSARSNPIDTLRYE